MSDGLLWILVLLACSAIMWYFAYKSYERRLEENKRIGCDERMMLEDVEDIENEFWEEFWGE